MSPSEREKELSFQRPHHAVELVERALGSRGASVVCVARSESRLFITFQIFQKFRRRTEKAGMMILLVNDESVEIVKPFLNAIANQSVLSVETYFDEDEVTGSKQWTHSSCDILVTKATIFLRILNAGVINFMSISLIIFDQCHLAAYADHPFALILKHADKCKVDLKPKVVGLSSGISYQLACLQDIEWFLRTLEEAFNCKTSVSHDLLALNRYGERIDEDIVYYTCTSEDNQLTCKLKEVLQNAVSFLDNISEPDVMQECVLFVKHVLSECNKVLLLLGPESTVYIARITMREITKFEKKCTKNSDLLILQYCRTQLNLVVTMLKNDGLESCIYNLTDLTEKLLFQISTYLKPVYVDDNCSQETACQDGLCADSHLSSGDQAHLTDEAPRMFPSLNHLSELQPVAMATATKPQPNCVVTSQPPNVATTYQFKSTCNDPLCVILVPSTIVAKALNSLINKLSDTIPEYGFLKSACVYGNRTKQEKLEQGMTDEMEEKVMECVQDGSVNVLVATFAVERELYVRRCGLLIRQGMPKDYKHFSSIKNKLKSAGAKLIILLRQSQKAKAEENVKGFQRIEGVLAERCPYSSLPCHEIKKLFLDDQPVAAYEPFGEGGAKVDLLSSISLVNSYCAKFPGSGAGPVIPVCRAEEVRSESEVEFLSTLYLPRNSHVYWPIKGSVTMKIDEVNEETAIKARIQSKMCVALEACRQLHKAGELNDDLQPVMRFQLFGLTAENEACECEVADTGVGLEGSVKRIRTYEKKRPSVLEDNFPVPDEPCYVYSVNMELTKPWTFDRAVRSQSKASRSFIEAVYSLGIVSRKPLPRLPAMLVFDRAGEVTVTVTDCISPSYVPGSDELFLLQRFTGYIFNEIAKPKGSLARDEVHFDPAVASFGYYIALLKNTSAGSVSPSTGVKRKELAFDFLQSIEKALGSFDNPTDPPPAGIQDMEIFEDAVVTTVYNEKCSRYYVVDICYDRSPADPFPNSEIVATFAEYYKERYGAEVTLSQPMLDVDHISSRLNFLLPRYYTIKGQNLSIPNKASKRSQRSQVFVIPELCSVHPLPGYLWRQLFILPAVLYRVESLLVAEEFRSSVARELGKGAVEWPNNAPLPLLNLGEMVGEEIVTPREYAPDGICDEHIGNKTLKPSIADLMNRRDSVALEARDESLGTNEVETKPVTLRRAREETAVQTTSVLRDSEEKPSEMSESHSSELQSQDSTSCAGGIKRHSTELSKNLSNILISAKENPDTMTTEKQISQDEKFNRGSSFASCDGPEKSSLSANKAYSSGTNVAVSEIKHVSASVGKGASLSEGKGQPLEAADSEISPSTIWTDPLLSRVYKSCGPSSTLILRAFTTCSAGDVFSLERLEMLGDSFVKYAISASVFFEHRHRNEGKLSFIRGLKVSNRQLVYLARHRGLPSYMITRMFNPLNNWLPPGFYPVDDHEDFDPLTNSQLFLMPEKNSQELEEDEEDGSLFVQVELAGSNITDSREGTLSEGHYPIVQLSPYFHHACSDKAVADATEALIGAYLLCYGPGGAWSLLEWLGMELAKQVHVPGERACNTTLSEGREVESDLTGCDHDAYAACQMFDKQLLQSEKQSDNVTSDRGFLPCPLTSDVNETLNCRPSEKLTATDDDVSEKTSETVPLESVQLLNQTVTNTQITTSPAAPSFNEAFLPPGDPRHSHPYNTGEFTAIEEVLNYRFRDHFLLLQAFTHTSLPRDYNAVLSSYEQLEFLGDALLDFLVTRHLYLNHRHMSPGDLTDLRAAVVNNYSFAVLAVKLGFTKHLRSLSPPLFNIVNKFVLKLKEKEMKQHQGTDDEIYASVFFVGSEDGELDEVEVPKVLGDLFEAVAGALYVDCGQDLEIVWQAYQPILKPTIDYHSANPSMSAVRRLIEMRPNAVMFAPVERMVDGKFKSTLTLLGYGTFVGTGRNFRIAKSSAAQRALNALKQSKKENN